MAMNMPWTLMVVFEIKFIAISTSYKYFSKFILKDKTEVCGSELPTFNNLH